MKSLFTWFETRLDSFPEAESGRPPAQFWPFVWHYTRPFRGLLLLGALFSVAVALIEVYLFWFMGDLVNMLAAANPDTFWQENCWYLAGVGFLVLAALPLCSFMSELISNQGVRGTFAMRIRWEAHRYVLGQSLDFFQNDFAGRIATKVMQTALGVRDAVMKATEVIVYIIVYYLGALLLMLQSDWRLMVPMLIWFAAYMATMWFFVPRLSALSGAQADLRAAVTGRVVDSYTNIATVKLFAHADRENLYAKEGMEWMLEGVNKSLRMVTLMNLTLALLSGFLIFASAAMSIWLWSLSAISLGAIAFTLALALRLQGMSQWIIWEVTSLFEDVGVIHDGIKTVARDRTVTDAPGAPALVVSRGEIRFDQVSFNYGKTQGAAALEDVSLVLRAGEKVGLVGRSGAGKSTLTSLLLRFYDVESGAIFIDGKNIAEVTQASLRANIGMVTQDASLLHRSVRENILYGRPDASFEALEAAAAQAHADGFIRNLVDPKGNLAYEAQVGERGVKLSGGQRQRVAIARVLLKNAPILVLDEATSALDSEVEAAIQESLNLLMEGKTVIAVAHRLSTIAAMDRLIVLDEGRIIEDGSHTELLQKGGVYAALWGRQSGGFIGDIGFLPNGNIS